MTPTRPGAAADPTTLAGLVPDPHNRRRHPARNVEMIATSLRAVGAARSIVIDEANEVLAGNGVVEGATAAGLSKLLVVDADGDTVVAVRRRGLTPEQKRVLAMYDNRAAELAEWNVDQLRDDAAAGMDLAPFEFDVQTIGAIDVVVVDAPPMPDGTRAPYQQMTFTLHDEQVQIVKDAVAAAREAGGDSTLNTNTNGNALAYICAEFLRG